MVMNEFSGSNSSRSGSGRGRLLSGVQAVGSSLAARYRNDAASSHLSRTLPRLMLLLKLLYSLLDVQHQRLWILFLFVWLDVFD